MSGLSRVSPLHRSVLKSPLRIVSIGGGNGLSTLLSGLKKHAYGVQNPPEGGSPIQILAGMVCLLAKNLA